MKISSLPLLIMIVWTFAAVDFRIPNFAPALQAHNVYKNGNTVVTLPGLNSRLTNDLLIDHSPFLKELRELGYRLRLNIGAIPDWLVVVPDPIQPELKQLVLREEIADEFSSPSFDEKMKSFTIRLAAVQKEFQSVAKNRIVIFIVPTKIAANQVPTDFSQISVQDSERFDPAESFEHSGAFEKQRAAESVLRKNGAIVVSPIDLYRRRQKIDPLLYPRGESHWSGDIQDEAARLIIHSIEEDQLISAACVRDGHSQSDEMKFYFGDLFEGLGWDESFHVSQIFSSKVPVFEAEDIKRKANPECPPLILAGSSYGVSAVSGLNMGDLLQIYYLGPVQNRSQLGKDGLYVLGEVQKNPPAANSIVIWEFPFRFIKHVQ